MEQLFKKSDECRIQTLKQKWKCEEFEFEVSGDTRDECCKPGEGVLDWSKCANNVAGFTEI